MSEGEGSLEGSDLQMLTAEYKDGQLQIVEVTPFDKGEMGEHSVQESNGIMSGERYDDDNGETKFTVLESSKGLVELDLLNYTLVRCEDDSGESYQFVENSDGVDSNETSDETDATVTCVLQTSDNETEQDTQESYVLVDNQNGEGPLVFLQSSLQQANMPKKEEPKKKSVTYAEILEKAKALQKAKALVSKSQPPSKRKRKGDLPSPHELLASPNFKLYLYSCKWCGFKCNAIKEMSAHKAAVHANGAASRATSGRSQLVTLQCARCPFRGNTHMQLLKHIHENHDSTIPGSNAIQLDTEEVEAADVLVCGACGFESSSRNVFKRHIEDVHGATTC